MKNYFPTLLFSILLVNISFCNYQKRELPESAKLRLVVESNSKRSKACLFEMSFPDSVNSGCKAEILSDKWKECNYVFPEDPTLSPERAAVNQILKILSQIELNEKSIRKKIHSVNYIKTDETDIKILPLLESELKKSLDKFKISSSVAFLRPVDSSELIFKEMQSTSETVLLEMGTKNLKLTKSKSIQKPFIEENGFSNFISETETHISDFAACRQGFSPVLKSTGKSGLQNFYDCKDFLKTKLDKSKILKDPDLLSSTNTVVYGEGFYQIKELLKSDVLSKSELEQAADQGCSLSILEIMKLKKISKDTAKSMCYSLSLVASILDTIKKDSVKVLNDDIIAKAVSVSPKINSDCSSAPVQATPTQKSGKKKK